MRLQHAHDVAAPLSHVRYVLAAVDEYPAWNSMEWAGPGDARWSVPLSNDSAKPLIARVAALPDQTLICLRRFGLRVELRVQCVGAGRHHTLVNVDCSVSRRLPFSRSIAVTRMLRTFCIDLSTRARWLPQAPDSSFVRSRFAGSSGLEPEHASLEQLHNYGRELEGGIVLIDCGCSWCLIDTMQYRFVRADPGADIARLVAFARWQHFDSVRCEGVDVVIAPSAGAAPVRIRPRRATAREQAYTTDAGSALEPTQHAPAQLA